MVAQENKHIELSNIGTFCKFKNFYVLFVKISYTNMLSCFPNLPRDKYAAAYTKESINGSST